MGSPADFSQFVFRILYRFYEVSEAVGFIALVFCLTFLLVRHLVKLAKKKNA
jgi:hypothetical protein